jgi:hypothetical protein
MRLGVDLGLGGVCEVGWTLRKIWVCEHGVGRVIIPEDRGGEGFRPLFYVSAILPLPPESLASKLPWSAVDVVADVVAGNVQS